MAYFEDMAFLADTYRGFTNPWRSRVDPRNGEDTYTALLAEHVTPETVVLEAGCGHGVEALAIAPRAREVIAFDAVDAFIRIAEQARRDATIANVQFVVADCSPKRNAGRAVLPAPDASVDLVVSRRGPTSWIGDARRAVRPGGALIQVAYMEPPIPEWNDELPQSLRMREHPESMPGIVIDRLAAAGIPLHSSWMFDVPEVFDDARELYARLAWERRSANVPAYEDCHEAFEAIFARPDHTDGVVVRHRRFLWKAVVVGA